MSSYGEAWDIPRKTAHMIGHELTDLHNIDHARNFFERQGIPTRLSVDGLGAEAIDVVIRQLEVHGMTQLGEHRDVTPAVSRRVLEAAL